MPGPASCTRNGTARTGQATQVTCAFSWALLSRSLACEAALSAWAAWASRSRTCRWQSTCSLTSMSAAEQEGVRRTQEQRLSEPRWPLGQGHTTRTEQARAEGACLQGAPQLRLLQGVLAQGCAVVLLLVQAGLRSHRQQRAPPAQRFQSAAEPT